jgi:esterase
VPVLYHRDLGGAGRPPLVLLHGFLGSSRNWQTAGAALAAQHHVLALDLRNHGRSPHAPEMTFAAMADDVLGWLDARGPDRVALLGHSLGGKLAMRLACRHPARIARLVVVDIAPKAYPGATQRAEIVAMNELRLEGLRSRAEAEMRMAARVPDWPTRKFLTTNLERGEDGRWRWIVNLAALTAALPDLVGAPIDPGDRFDGPAQFILGGKSQFVVAADHAAIRHHFPQARIEVIAGSGHNPHMEQREEFVRRVLAGGDRATTDPGSPA